MAYRTEIRQSTLDRMRDRVKARNYDKYLLRMKLVNLRSYRDAEISFDFPVTALVGPNGGGKSSVLNAIACLYKGFKPRLFFPNSSVDNGMTNIEIRYEAIDRAVSRSQTVSRTATFRQSRWRRDGLDRAGEYFGIRRAVPAGERSELNVFKSSTRSFGSNAIVLSESVRRDGSRILSKDISGFKIARLSDEGECILIGELGSTHYSEFHFGAGESNVIRMLMELERIQDQGVILIEEVETTLHPVATRLLVEHLIRVADEKRVQVIFTTHSPYAIEPLPPEAVWACCNGELRQGALDLESLLTLTGHIDSKLAIYVEDEMAAEWLAGALRYAGEAKLLEAVKIHVVGGDGRAAKMAQAHNEDPDKDRIAICFIDGNSKVTPDGNIIFQLPDKDVPPEFTIARDVVDTFDQSLGVLTVALGLDSFSHQPHVAKIVRENLETTRDEHILFGKIGDALGFITHSTVRTAFIAAWCRAQTSKRDCIVDIIRKKFSEAVAATLD